MCVDFGTRLHSQDTKTAAVALYFIGSLRGCLGCSSCQTEWRVHSPSWLGDQVVRIPPLVDSVKFLVVWSNVALVTKRGRELRLHRMPDRVSLESVNGWKDGGCCLRATGFLLAEQIAHPSQSFHGLMSNQFSIYPQTCLPGHHMHNLFFKPVFLHSVKT